MTLSNRENITLFFIATVSVVGVVWSVLHGPIPQDPAYHRFADARTILRIPNFWNVMSNAPFVLVGILGLLKMRALEPIEASASFRGLFAGTLLMGLGSAFYHLAPDNETLAVDRLAMTIVFMSLFSVVVIELVSARLGKALLIPLLVAGVISVLYWIATEHVGRGDLRAYGVVQFLPMLIIPSILLGFRRPHTSSFPYWILLLAYTVAKVLEFWDTSVYNVLGEISGHSLKHIVSAIGLYALVRSYGTPGDPSAPAILRQPGR